MKVRLFVNQVLEKGKIERIPQESVNYLLNVLKLKTADEITVFNGRQEFDAAIIIDNRSVFIKIKSLVGELEEIGTKIYLCIANLKNSAMAEVLNNCTQTGVFEFLPIVTQHTVNHHFAMERAKKIVIEASEQSCRISIPEIRQLQKFECVLQNIEQDAEVVFADEKAGKNMHILSIKARKIYIFIGPEGGFTEEERAKLLSLPNMQAVSFGRNILRAETAATCATFLVNYIASL